MTEALIVVIAGEKYAVPMACVVEVRVYHRATFLPGAPEWVCGFMELHGKPVEVFDAARRLGRGELRLDACSCVIFIETTCGVAGMLIDGVEGIVADDGAVPAIDVERFFTDAVA
ncbi:MAG TPA: chemotaxis protein CheW [Thermoanaerobaculia bacterium]